MRSAHCSSACVKLASTFCIPLSSVGGDEILLNMCCYVQVEQLEGPAAQIDAADFFWAEPPKPKVGCLYHTEVDVHNLECNYWSSAPSSSQTLAAHRRIQR